VITVCDQSREACPVFPGSGESLHWGYDDPSEVEGTEADRLEAFRKTLTLMSTRIQAFVSLAKRDRAAVEAH